MLRNDSVIVNTFFGQDKSQLWCPNCQTSGKSRRKFDPRLSIHVNVPSVKKFEVFVFRNETKEHDRTCMNVEIYDTCDSKVKALIHEVSRQVEDTSPENRRFCVCAVKFGRISKIISWGLNSNDNDDDNDDERVLESIEDLDNDICIYEIPLSFSRESQKLIEIHLNFSFGTVQQKYRFPFVVPCSRTDTREKCVEHIKEALKRYASDEEMIPKFKSEEIMFKLKHDGIKCIEVAELSIPFSEETFLRRSFRDSYQNNNNNNNGKRRKILKEALSLSECLKSTFKKEQLGQNDTWYCPDCKNHVRAFKQMWIWSLADTLVLHLNRFIQTAQNNSQMRQGFSVRTEKKHTPIEIPMKIDMSPFVIGPQSQDGSSLVYELFAVSHHFGGAGGGHYTAQIKHSDGKWYNCDDSSVSEKEVIRVDAVSAYALFYKRVVLRRSASSSDKNDDIVNVDVKEETPCDDLVERGSSNSSTGSEWNFVPISKVL